MEFIKFLIILFMLTLFMQLYMDRCDEKCQSADRKSEDFGSVQRYYSDNADGVQDINLTVTNDSDGLYDYPWYYPWHISPWYMPTRIWNHRGFYPYLYNYYRGYY